MSAPKSAIEDVSQKPMFAVIQQRISIFAWAITILLSLRGMFELYGMKQKGDIELFINSITEPVVRLFQFRFLESLQQEIPGITALFATISILLMSYITIFTLKYVELRYILADRLLARLLISRKIAK